MKLVSVILPVFNEKIDYLKTALDSIRSQSYRDIELIIVDDSDNAGVIDYLTGVAGSDKRVVYIHNQQPCGLTKSINKGLAVANGFFIGRADSDDIQHPQRIEKQVAFLQANPDVGIVGASIRKIDGSGRSASIRYYPTRDNLLRQMMIRNAIAHPTVMMRRSVIDSVGSYDESFLKAEDYELWMRAIKRGIKICNLAEPLVEYRLPDTAKRDNVNWISNLKVKLRYFGCDYLIYRMIGILAVLSMIIAPCFLRRLLYRVYNRIV